MPQRIHLTFPTGDSIRYALSSDMTLEGIGPEQASNIFTGQTNGTPFAEGGRYRVYWRDITDVWDERNFEDFSIPVLLSNQTGSPTQIRMTFPLGDDVQYALSSDLTLGGIGPAQTSTVFTGQTNGAPFEEGEFYRVYWQRDGEAWNENNFVEFYFRSTPADRYHYTHLQNTPSSIWQIKHNLGYKPAGIVVHDSAGEEWEPLITYVDNNKLTLSFGLCSFAGTAELS